MLALLLAVLVLVPSAAFAQQSRAGVVTTLEGNVTARRVALPGPLPLKFKDDVFLQDTVTTGEKSLARMLLGGKAVVTVRERSVITITEVPGKSTIDLETGKFALAVAREKMRPGEEIQIRTPNAVAGVRGTVVVTEVNRQSAQAGGGAPAVVTNFFVLRGSIVAQPLDPASRQPVGTPLPVGTMQAYSGAGTAPPSVAPVPPEQVGQITSGLQPQGPKGGSAAGQEQVKTQQVQAAVTLLTTLTGGSAILASDVPLQQPTTGITTEQNPTIVPIIPTLDDTDKLLAFSSQLAGTISEFQNVTGAVSLSGPAKTFSGSFTSTATSSLFQLLNAVITQTGEGVDFISLLGATVSVAGPLVTFVDSSLITPGSLFEMLGGSFASSTGSALFDLDPSSVTAGGALIALNGGSFSLSGPLLVDVGGTFDVAGALLRVQNGTTFVNSGAGALIQLSGTTVGSAGGVLVTDSSMSLAGPLASVTGVTPGGGGDDAPLFGFSASSISSSGTSPFLQFASSELDNGDNFLALGAGSTLTLAGSLLRFTDTRFSATDVTRSFIAVVDGSKITQANTTDPLLSFAGTASGLSRVSSARNFFTLSFNTSSSSPSMSLSGPFLTASSTEFKTGDPTANTFTFLFIGDGAQVSSTSTAPFMSFTNSSLDTAGDVLTIRRSTASTPSRLTLAGPLLTATNSTFNHTSLGFDEAFSTSPSACCSAFFVAQGGHLTSTTNQALIQLTGSTFVGIDAQSGGNFFHVADTFGGAGASEVVARAVVSLAGPLLSSTNSSISSLFNLIRIQRSSLTSTSSSPLVDVSGGTISLGGTNPIGGTGIGNLLNVISSANSGETGLAASVTLAGPLARLTDATYNSGAGNVATISNGATYTSSGSGAMFQLTNSTVTGFNLLSVAGTGGPSGTAHASASLAGPLLATSGGTTSLGRHVATVSGSLTSTGTGALVQLSGGTFKTGTSSTDGGVMLINGTSPGLVTLAGPVLTAGSGAALTASGALFAAFNGGRLVVNNSTAALYGFNGGTHTFATATGADRDAAFILNGSGGPTTNESVTVLFDSCGDNCINSTTQTVTYGTREPVEHSGTLLDATGGTYTTNRIMRVDTALLEASSPILHLKSGANMTVNGDGIDLSQSKLDILSTNNPLVRLDASSLLVNGALLSARNSSFLNVAGSAINLAGGSTLTVNGPLLFAASNSVVKITGPLVTFGSGSNVINVTNNLCGTSSCQFFGPFKVSLGPGANSNNIIIGSEAVQGSGTINLPNTTGSVGAHIRVEGANTRINICPNCNGS